MPISRINSASIANSGISAADIADATITAAKIISVANTQITGNIVSSQIAPSVTLTTPIISGNLNLDSAGTTGIRAPSANTIAFHTAGTEDMRIDANGNVGIGTSSPSYRLEVKGPSATAGQLSIHDGAGDTVVSDTNAASLLFQCRDSSIRTIAEIDGVHTTTNGTGGAMVFQTRISDVLAERMRIDSSGNLQFNSGYGSVVTAYGCRAWVNFNGTGTPAIRASGNVSSITDDGTGVFTVNFTTAMVDANYSIAAISSTTSGNGATFTTVREAGIGGSNPSTTSFQLSVRASSFADLDVPYIYAQVFR
jgi:hypothetical protein